MYAVDHGSTALDFHPRPAALPTHRFDVDRELLERRMQLLVPVSHIAHHANNLDGLRAPDHKIAPGQVGARKQALDLGIILRTQGLHY